MDSEKVKEQEKEEEEFDMAAIQSFMLGGGSSKKKAGSTNNRDNSNTQSSIRSNKKKKKKKKGKGNSGSDATLTRTPPRSPASSSQMKNNSKTGKAATPQSITPQQRREEQRLRNNKRQYWRLYKSFFAIVDTEWLDMDNQLEAVVGSIDNIRSRLPMESRILHTIKDEDDWESKKPWDGYALGYSTRREHNFALRVEDIRLAQGHDLEQHEKMLAGLRRLLSAISEVQEALGRKLDELMGLHWECCEDMDLRSEHSSLSSISMQTLVDEASLIYNQLAMELYRKQGLVKGLLDSVADDMIEPDERSAHEVVGAGGDDILNVGRSSKGAASSCSKEWPRGSENSCVETSLLLRCLKRCEGTEM